VSLPDAIVVGAGIVGGACAEALAAEGLSVLILERDFPGAGATAAAMGHLVVMDDSPAQLALTARSRSLWEARADQLDASCEDDACGTLWIASQPEELEHVEAKARRYAEHGVAAEVLDARQLAEAEPELRPDLAGALRVPGDRVVYPPAAARWFLERARARGARVRLGASVAALDARSVELSGGERLAAGLVVNAAGAAAASLTPELPIEPRRGHLAITERRPGFCRHQLIELGYLNSAHGRSRESVAFNVQPRATGQLLLGSSREYVGWDPEPNRALLSRMLQGAVAYLPRLAGLNVLRTWVGFRPATPDKLPWIGTTEAGVWVAAGHEGLGITTATGTAELIADLVMGRQPALDPAPYSPRRSAGP
jgi:glycine/D-amino acid oxidase-like deaminating enzyme